MTGLSRSALYGSVKIGTFPNPVKIGGRAIAYVQDEVLVHINSTAAGRDSNSNRSV